uniref:PD-(D/E)XK nuclease superfamily protein n=1 Tax=Candidatus Kentrum sp. UNK TaxID=2126344 RepID=A0A451A3Z4_9GAMM|nr:MAG: PD-(D/E)XK nuclease superfamily protein [Candidatus Kentron sp. UNK]VFK69455.1 MAG: PD-(D/E)XK nuclease superfamily protein [Candidatus Kentron sp. UNK]
MENLKKLPIGIQDFEELRQGNYVYVDKTKLIHHLITNGVAWFLSRPRRFGKSLLISTLAAIFQGRRDLFDGLWIASSDYDWPVHPVIHIDMSRVTFETLEQFQSELVRQLDESAIEHGLESVAFDRAAPMLDHLIGQLARKKGKVVVLVDEYDKPILKYLTETPRALEIRDRVRDFYTILKARNKNLRFVFLTGVSRFSKVSVFSELNHLNDITYTREYATMLGYTQEELESDFSTHIHSITQQEDTSVSKLLHRIQSWYNGYRFHPDVQAVYNPFSCLKYFQEREFKPWWFETGTPTFLIELLRKSSLSVMELEQKIVCESDFSSFDVERLKPLPLLLQTGYLTITNYDSHERLYTLDYPNREVREGFLIHLIEGFSGSESENVANDLWRLRNALATGKPDTFFVILTGIFSGIPYDIQVRQERYYQSLFYLIFRLMGMHIHVEVRTATGRIDATVDLESGVWIFEFKLDSSADAALTQIREKNYAAPYVASGKPIYLVDANFDSKKRNVNAWKIETLELRDREPQENIKRVRAIFIGNGDAGKTSLIQALNEQEAVGDTEMTPGIEISEWQVGDTGLTAHFWDFGGQVIAHATHQFFLRARCVYVLVLNARSADSNPNQQAEYWLEFVRAFGKDAPVLLVGNKCDQTPVAVDFNRLREGYPNIRGFHGLSATEYRGKYAREFGIFKDAFIGELTRIGEDARLYFSREEFNLIEALRAQSRQAAFLEKRAFDELCAARGIEEGERRDEFLSPLAHPWGLSAPLFEHPAQCRGDPALERHPGHPARPKHRRRAGQSPGLPGGQADVPDAGHGGVQALLSGPGEDGPMGRAGSLAERSASVYRFRLPGGAAFRFPLRDIPAPPCARHVHRRALSGHRE